MTTYFKIGEGCLPCQVVMHSSLQACEIVILSLDREGRFSYLVFHPYTDHRNILILKRLNC